jgi:hypothetical protein
LPRFLRVHVYQRRALRSALSMSIFDASVRTTLPMIIAELLRMGSNVNVVNATWPRSAAIKTRFGATRNELLEQDAAPSMHGERTK